MKIMKYVKMIKLNYRWLIVIYFLAFVFVENYLWHQPIISMLLLIAISIIALLTFRTKFHLIIFILMAILGPLSEIILIKIGVMNYSHLYESNLISIFGLLPLWLPFAWGIVGVSLYEVSRQQISFLDYLKEKNMNKLRKISSLVFILVLIPIMLFAVIYSKNPLVAVIAIIVVFLLLLYFQRNLNNAVYFINGALFGLLAEGTTLQQGIYSYAGENIFNVPLWLGLTWGLTGIIIYRLVNFVDKFHKKEQLPEITITNSKKPFLN